MDKIKKPIWTKDFIGISIINLALFFGFQMLLPTLPVYVKSLGGADSVIGWIAGLSTIASLIIRPFSGLALDRFGRKGVFLTGIGIIIIVTLCYMWFPVVGIILVIRFLHGLGWGMASTASSTIATDAIPKERFGEGMGYFGLSSSIAMALAPGIGLSVMTGLQINGLAIISAGFVIIALVLSFFIHYRQVDRNGEMKKPSSPYERSAIKPSMIMFFVSASYGSITGFISLYALNQGIKNIGVFFIVFALAMLFSRPLFGKIIDRKGFSTAVYPGLIILTSAMLVLYQASTLPLFLCAALLYGIGFGAVQSSLQTMSVAHAPKDRLGAANATFFTGFDGGIGFGSILAGITASALGYSKMYLVFSIFLLIGGLLYFCIADKSSSKVKS